MEENNQNNLPDIIRERKLLPVETKQNIMDNTFFNYLLFIIMLTITLIINMSFKRLSIRDFNIYIKVVQMICGLASVAGLEIAFRKNSGKFAMYGIETLIFSICVLFVPHMYFSKGDINFLRNATIVFFIYYLVKSLGTLIYKRHKYLKENLSDIKELVKEEKESYIDEESVKTLKEQKIKEEKRKKAREARKAKLAKEATEPKKPEKSEKTEKNKENKEPKKTKNNNEEKNKSDKKLEETKK